MTEQNDEILLRTEHLNKYFTERKHFPHAHPQVVKAVNDISLEIRKGEALGLVGESGCGKSTLGRTILRLIPASGGKVYFHGQDIFACSETGMHGLRRKMQIIFQDAYNSLNPRMTIGDLVQAPLDVFREGTPEERREKVIAMLQDVGMSEECLNRFPHQFLGGQLQRIGIARALILDPELVICDEPVSALDVSVRAQVLNLLRTLQKKRNLTYLFISHDLSVVHHVCDRVAVMYLGRIIELADKDELYGNPCHPYTKALLSSIPVIGGENRRNRILLRGEIPDSYDMPAGCAFAPRCGQAEERCRAGVPELREIAPGHYAACFLAAPERNI